MNVAAKCLIESKYFSDSASVEYIAPTNTHAIIDKFTATNLDGSSQTVSIYLVPSGGSAGNDNLIVKEKSISSGDTESIDELKNHTLNSGDSIQVLASIASKIVGRASGREVTS